MQRVIFRFTNGEHLNIPADFLGKKEPKAETEPKLPSENMKELEESDSDSAEEKASITITPSESKQTDEE
jgi:hypothetical protein